MRWGLVPSWAPDESIGNRMINTRAETLTEKPSFKRLVAYQRCLVPGDGFYEWRREGNRKVPVFIHLKNRQPFAFAGLWDLWRNRDTGNALYTFTIITCEPNSLLRSIHNRMPVIYDDALGRQWLDPTFSGTPRFLAAVLGPLDPSLMESHDVSTVVNSPAFDKPECVEPVES